MEISVKAAIIEEFMRDEEINEQFFEDEIHEFTAYNDLGIPLSQAVTYGLATLTDEGKRVVDETWFNLCSLLDIDPGLEYETLDDCLFAEDDDDV